MARASSVGMKGFAPWILWAMYALAVTAGMLSGGAWALVGIGGSLLLALSVWIGQKQFPAPAEAEGFFVFVLLMAMGFSCWKAIDPSLALYSTVKMATVLLPLLFLTSPLLRAQGELKSLPLIALALFFCLGLFVLDIKIVRLLLSDLEDGGFLVAKLNRGFSYGALLAFPFLAGLFAPGRDAKARRRAGLCLLGCLALTLLLSHSRATQTGLLLAACVFILTKFWPLLTLWILRLGVVSSCLWAFAGKFLFTRFHEAVLLLPDSWQARLEIWDYMSRRISENPLSGYGIGNAHLVDNASSFKNLYVFSQTAAAHPHNAMTQFWLELGFWGVILGVWFGFWVLQKASLLPDRLRPYAYGAFMLAFWLSMTAYNVWSDSLWAAFALTALAFELIQNKKLKLP